MGSAKMSEGFSQDASWQKMIIAKTDLRIDEQDIQISMELKILITIIEEESANMELLKRHLSIYESIFADKNGNSLKGFGHKKRLVARLFG